jgi:hypothetical protein
MRAYELFGENRSMKPQKSAGTVRPLTADQLLKHTAKKNAAISKLSDIKSKAAIDIQAANRKISDT